MVQFDDSGEATGVHLTVLGNLGYEVDGSITNKKTNRLYKIRSMSEKGVVQAELLSTTARPKSATAAAAAEQALSTTAGSVSAAAAADPEPALHTFS